MGCYVHNVPGRLRVKILGLKLQEHQAVKIRNLFNGLYGISKISINTLTGSIILYYDSSVFSVDQLLNILKYNNLIDSNRPIVFEKPVSERSTKMGMAFGKAVFSWAVGKALERSGLGFLAIFI
ncbi:MAG: hypothetical protein R6U27_03310 [Desulfobacterales bacterium]